MAKVIGPLMSTSASGKLANSMVFFPWKGKAVVRRWLKPRNPQSTGQGEQRVLFGGTGRATRVIQQGSKYYDDAKLVAPVDVTYVSGLVQYILKNWLQNKDAFNTEYTAYSNHTAKSDFDSAATTLGLVTYDLGYAGYTNKYTGGMQLYELARYAIAKRNSVEGAFDREPYKTTLSSWDADKISLLVADLAAS